MMGLFSKKQSDDERPSRTKRVVAGEGRESTPELLKQRARRRLIGAITLLFTAVVVIPMFLDVDPKLLPHGIAVNIPNPNPEFTPPAVAAPPAPDLEVVASVPTAPSNNVTLPPIAVPNTPSAPANRPAASSTTTAPATNPVPPAPVTPPAAQTPPAVNQEQLAREQALKAQAAKEAAERQAAEQRAAANRQAEAERVRAIFEGRDVNTSVPSTSTKFAVQVGAFSSSEAANKVKEKLQQNGITASIETVTLAGNAKVYRVRVLGLNNKEDADTMLGRVKQVGYPDSSVLTL